MVWGKYPKSMLFSEHSPLLPQRVGIVTGIIMSGIA